jgi:hypothetical protein
MGKANLVFGDIFKGKLNKRLSGPKPLRHNVTNEQFLIYDRRQKPRGPGTKFQYFTVRDDKQGMGRVYDSRRSYAYLSPGIKFPLGYWTQGETRTLTAKFLENAYEKTGGPPRSDLGNIDRTRTQTWKFEITITDLYYTFSGMKHCLGFRWRHFQGSYITNFFEYIYCPRRGQVSTDTLGR